MSKPLTHDEKERLVEGLQRELEREDEQSAQTAQEKLAARAGAALAWLRNEEDSEGKKDREERAARIAEEFDKLPAKSGGW